MYVFIAPVSGGGFVSQLAILQHLCESDIIPDISLASSGGNVAIYIAAAAGWKWAGIERIARELRGDLFVRPWSSILPLSFIIGYFKGDVFNKGGGVKDLLTHFFPLQSISTYEIWTGTFNKHRQRARLFCNKKMEDSILDVSCIDHDLNRSMAPIFMGGHIEAIAKASMASASIPAVVPAEIIEEEAHIDGGVAGASPLSIMQEPILKYVRTHGSSLHLFYINSIDISSSIGKECHNVVDTWRQATTDLIRSQTVNDRLSAYELLRCHPGVLRQEQFECTYDNIERVKKIQAKIRYSLLEIYPKTNLDINVINFTGDEVVGSIKAAYDNCACRLWWLELVPDQEPALTQTMDEVCRLLEECKSGRVASSSSSYAIKIPDV
jgi:predicted acylesterase/phospholipase RssA